MPRKIRAKRVEKSGTPAGKRVESPKAEGATYKNHIFVPKGRGVTARRILDAMFDFAGESSVHAVDGGWEVHFDDVKFCDPRREVVAQFLDLMETSRREFEAKFNVVPLTKRNTKES